MELASESAFAYVERWECDRCTPDYDDGLELYIVEVVANTQSTGPTFNVLPTLLEHMGRSHLDIKK